MQDATYAIVVHGGAGIILKDFLTSQQQQTIREKINQALQAGYQILKQNKSSLDAVEAAIRILQDSQLFNAGKGAVLSNKSVNELDACIMQGKVRKAGAVAGVTKIKNPISAARKVMEKTKHVMLSGEGANQFAFDQGLEIVQPSYFHNQMRINQLMHAKQQQKTPNSSQNKKQNISFHNLQFNPNTKPIHHKQHDEKKMGTVGAVALDTYGVVAAGTSTGGMTNKKYGRIGDSPIVGAGCYAHNQTCAVSSTGEGQYFIRGVIAYDISAMMEFSNCSLKQASQKAIYQRLQKLGGTGGVISIDKNCNISMPFNTPGMFWGYLKSNGQKSIMIYKQ